MIQGFILDPAFVDQTLNVVDLDDIPGTHGHLSSKTSSYFVDPIIIKDRRTLRLPLYGLRLTSKMSLQFDTSVENIAILANASVADLNGIFNIIEKVLYRVIEIPLSTLELELTTDTSTYPNYVPESLYLSTNANSVRIYDVLNENRYIIDYTRFKVLVGNTEVELTLWINNVVFAAQYTHSTISEIVSPVALYKLIDPTSLSDVYVAMSQAAFNNANMLTSKLSTSGYTGIVNYPTRYIEPSTGKSAVIGFNILYKGAIPGVLAIRLAIKTLLLTSGISNEITWKLRLPDIFVIAQFFVVPMWDNYVERPNRILFPSVIGLNTIRSKLDVVLPDIPEQTRYNFEILDVAYKEFVLVAIPDFLNQIATDIRTRHSTYQRYSPQDISFQYQEVLTREFSTRLNTALAVAAGEATDELLTWNTFGTRQYVSFVVDSIEYHILSRSSYLTLIGA